MDAWSAVNLIRLAPTLSDYWADKAMDWLSFGCSVDALFDRRPFR